MVELNSNVRATEPLIPREQTHDIREINAQIVAKVTGIIEKARQEAHVALWRKYIERHATPPVWRGRREIYHYDRLIAGLTRIRRSRTMRIRIHYDEHASRIVDGGGLPRVRYAEFLHEHIRSFENRALGKRDVAEVMRWFRGLDFARREKFLQVQRHEDAEAKRHDRLMEQLRKEHPEHFVEQEKEPVETLEGWEWEKTPYNVPIYEGRPRTTWRSRSPVRSGARRSGSNSSQPNRFHSCE